MALFLDCVNCQNNLTGPANLARRFVSNVERTATKSADAPPLLNFFALGANGAFAANLNNFGV